MKGYIGFVGTGNDIEFDLVTETERAFQIETLDGIRMWLPKSAFDDDGSLLEWGVELFHKKVNEVLDA